MHEFSVEECLGIIGFLCVIVAIANMYVLRLSVIWLCLAIVAGVIVFCWLVHLIVHVLCARRERYGKKQQKNLELSEEEQYVKGRIVAGSLSQQGLTSEPKKPNFNIPPLAGFAPQQLQASKGKKIDSQLDGKKKERGFTIPSLVGFAPQQFLASKRKKSRQAISPSSDGTSQQQQEAENVKLPSIVGFAPLQLPASERKKPHPDGRNFKQEPSPSPNFVPPALPPELFL
jgi:hypothetical protein